jgi:hypothetical protein
MLSFNTFNQVQQSKVILIIIYSGFCLMVSKENQALMEHGYISMKTVFSKKELFLKQIKQFLAVK